MKTALVAGAGGFIGSHLVKYLKKEGYYVSGVDLKEPEFSETLADDFVLGDLRDPLMVESLFDKPFDEVYQLAADMGGAGYLFTGDNDADVMHNSVLINLNMLKSSVKAGVNKIFYSSSACVYPEFNQMDSENPNCVESSVYPAQPDSEYGWEKLFSERLYFSFMRNYNIDVKVARFHNVFGPEGTFDGGKEKVPAAMARKVAEADDFGRIEVWGDGNQTRSFLYIDDCIEAVYKLVQSDFNGPVNIGSDQLISINDLAKSYFDISGKKLKIKHIEGPQGVRGRNSDNNLIFEKLKWQPQVSLERGLTKTYEWINEQVRGSSSEKKR
ncbi:nucleoside-diphosphate-sugar epimerase [Roseivirga ehrenbergii]|uniref:NAD-dependent dehydratase n=1 Tax=Roseivirga ehrenbergii (strain DSM 102268 / JCM 13514 / KCTC 12282 / NCIMB 14502 / KMM 6017) TaxID=279360 RepID=A0A150XQW6_ROSEK|nr:NAD-dependent epimerase/dehydratase family protein [Roseivirga ehrenbergii]KYG81035.1 NAD-dependent dehydratase [Roseivirga ehrenbergii]TCL00902.1 nucleoside-diphosphate-sugar epimerase [Roseivirga ehrenbergii]